MLLILILLIVDEVGCDYLELNDHDDNSSWPSLNGHLLCQNRWLTNHTFINGQVSIPDNMIGEGGEVDYPWFAPGTASVFSPCGTFGGNPFGCREDEKEQYGDCCDHHLHVCGGFSFGANAETFNYPDAAKTGWAAGSVQEAAWWDKANHGGGYNYRLCKVPDGGFLI